MVFAHEVEYAAFYCKPACNQPDRKGVLRCEARMGVNMLGDGSERTNSLDYDLNWLVI